MELINKENLIMAIVSTESKVAHKYHNGEITDTDAILVDREHEIIDLINEMPTIESRPTGKWIERYEEYLWQCSECGNVIYSESQWDRKQYHKFCGYCGAKMEDE